MYPVRENKLDSEREKMILESMSSNQLFGFILMGLILVLLLVCDINQSHWVVSPVCFQATGNGKHIHKWICSP